MKFRSLLFTFTLLLLALLSLNAASAACEETLFYIGTCPANSVVSVDLIHTGTANFTGFCDSGTYAVEIGSVGAGCAIDPYNASRSVLDLQLKASNAGNAQVLNSTQDVVSSMTTLRIINFDGPLSTPPSAANNVPTISLAVSQISAKQGTSVTIPFTTRDLDNDVLSVSIDDLRGGTLDFNSSTNKGTFTWTPAAAIVSPQDVTFTLVVTDGNDQSSETFTVTVVDSNTQNLAPTVTVTPKTTSVVLGQTVTLQVTASDPENDPLTYSYSPQIGNYNTATGTFTWTPSQLTDIGQHSIRFLVKDGTQTSTVTATIAVTSTSSGGNTGGGSSGGSSGSGSGSSGGSSSGSSSGGSSGAVGVGSGGGSSGGGSSASSRLTLTLNGCGTEVYKKTIIRSWPSDRKEREIAEWVQTIPYTLSDSDVSKFARLVRYNDGEADLDCATKTAGAGATTESAGICTTQWEALAEWSACADGEQFRQFKNANPEGCGPDQLLKLETRECSETTQSVTTFTDAPAATCTDGVQNGQETGLDCGGQCAPCQRDFEEQDPQLRDTTLDDGGFNFIIPLIVILLAGLLVGLVVAQRKGLLPAFDSFGKGKDADANTAAPSTGLGSGLPPPPPPPMPGQAAPSSMGAPVGDATASTGSAATAAASVAPAASTVKLDSTASALTKIKAYRLMDDIYAKVDDGDFSSVQHDVAQLQEYYADMTNEDREDIYEHYKALTEKIRRLTASSAE